MNTKLLRFFGVLFLGFGSVASVFSQSLQLRASTTEVVVNTPLSVTIDIEGVTNAGNIDLIGIDQFIMRGQSQSTTMQTINGVTRSQVQFVIQLEPTMTGNFVLGPAQFSEGTGLIQSNTLNISVIDIPVVEEEVTQGSGGQDNQLSVFKHRPFVLGFLLLGVGGIFLRQRKRTNQQGVVHGDKVLGPESEKIHLPIPAASDPAFWDTMDIWWRTQLSTSLQKDLSHATLEELRPEIIALPMIQQELFITALTVIQKAKYAGIASEASVLIDLAHRLEKTINNSSVH